jgi:rod shape-determining protein MreC
VTTLLRTQQLEVETSACASCSASRSGKRQRPGGADSLRRRATPISRRIVIDKGQQDKVVAGQPVIDDAGIVGQVTRVFPFRCRSHADHDKEQAVPVQIVRTVCAR